MVFNTFDHIILNWNLISPSFGILFLLVCFFCFLYHVRKGSSGFSWIFLLVCLQAPTMISAVFEYRLKNVLCQKYLNLEKDQCSISRKGSNLESIEEGNIRFIVIKRETLNKTPDTYSVYKKEEMDSRANLKEYYYIQLYPKAFDLSSFISLWENELPLKLERQATLIKSQVDSFLAYLPTETKSLKE